MSGVTVAEIREQEEAIFSDSQKYISHMKYSANFQQARAKALQQLALSEDSPFNLDGDNRQQLDTDHRGDEDEELKMLMDEKARSLREETEEIKRQLDLVRSQINELHERPKEGPRNGQSGSPLCCNHHGEEDPKQSIINSNQPFREMTGERRHEFVNNQQITSADSQFNQRNTTHVPKPPQPLGLSSDSNPRLRPLTGKTDCPNCACDRRRSVCDRCMEFQKQTVVQEDTGDSIIKRQPTFITEQQISNIISTSGQHEQRSTDNKVMNYRDYDERPIRPAKQGLDDLLSLAHDMGTSSRQHPKVDTSVDEVVVPGKLYTIGKSLNDKRTKLAQAIEDLQLMMEKLKKRGERLDQERKVAQLYKGQWRFGPSIGGSSSSIGASGRRGSCESLRGGVASTYQSRLDPNLARDSNSMMGFQHVESSMRSLHQRASTSKAPIRNRSQLPPKPKPRFSKLNTMQLANASNLYQRPTRSSVLHARSKSIESLHSQTTTSATKKKKPTATERLLASKGKQTKPAMSNNDANFLNGKSSSELDLAQSERQQQTSTSSLSSPDSSTAVEENLEQDEIREDEENVEPDRSRPESRSSSTDSTKQSVDGYAEPKQPMGTANQDHDRDKPKPYSNSHHQQQQPLAQPRKKTWVPLVGETEIKTIDVRAPQSQSKVVVQNTSSTSKPIAKNGQFKSILRTNQSSAMNKASLVNDRIFNEASKKLQFASDLLEREQHDSKTTNQLVVSRTRPLAPPRSNSSITQQHLRQRQRTTASPATRGVASTPRVTSGNERCSTAARTTTNADEPATVAQSVISGANKEIARLEQMISEQQALLLKLTQSPTVMQSPTVTTCCHHHSTTPCTPLQTVNQTQAKHAQHQQQPGRQLISNLRERLNKTKARLARTLEEERTKHQQLEQKVDSSLRKQSDLENENELLKKSLSKCIDTCLRDISSTFESLSDTLSESIYMDPQSGEQLVLTPTDANVSPLLSNAAQLIADNRHLKRMKSHIDSIERQRRAIFDELHQEKHKSHQLELELERSKLELEQLIGAKHQFESQLSETTTTTNTAASQVAPSQLAALEAQPIPSTSKQVNFAPSPTMSSDANHQTQTRTNTQVQQSNLTSESNSCSAQDDTTTSTTTTYNSIDTYRQYIQSMTPDLDAIRRERRMILDEFDNIKKMLSDMDNN